MKELMDKIKTSLAELEIDDFLEAVNEAIEQKIDAQIIVDTCAGGIQIVGDYFEDGEYFVGDLVYASEMLRKSMEVLEPLLGQGGGKSAGKLVIGTAQGDLHDIGKNIFASMMKSAGFEVFDLGVDVAPARFVEKIKEVQPQIVGISGLLTLSVEMMGTIVKEIEEAGLRDLKIMIGGNIVNDYAREHTGADAWSNNAAKGVKQCKEWVQS